MDIHHFYQRFVGDHWKPVDQSRFNVDRYVLNRESEVMMELVFLPVGAGFPHLVDFPTGSDVLVHQPLDFFVLDAQFPFNKPARRFWQVELDSTCDGPVSERVPVSRQPIWVSQAWHQTHLRLLYFSRL